jgi:hypothetical protein
VYNKLRVKFDLGLRRIFPGWDSCIYSEDISWLVGWERALLSGEPSAQVLSKLKRRAGQLKHCSVPKGDLKASCEFETVDFLVFLIRGDSQLANLVDIQC